MQCNNSQSGFVLFVSLVFLLVISLLGVTLLSSNTLQEKMVANLRDEGVAFQATETALRDGEDRIFAIAEVNREGFDDGAAGVWSVNSALLNGLLDNDLAWWTANAIDVADVIAEVNTQPKSVVQWTGFRRDSGITVGAGVPTRVDYYRVTARGSGYSDTSRVVLQSIFGRRY